MLQHVLKLDANVIALIKDHAEDVAGGLADIEVAQLVGLVTADRLLDVGKAGAMVHICEAGRERLVGLVRIGLRGSR